MPVSRLLGFPHTPVPMATDRQGAAEQDVGFQWLLHADPVQRPGHGLHLSLPDGRVRADPPGSSAPKVSGSCAEPIRLASGQLAQVGPACFPAQGGQETPVCVDGCHQQPLLVSEATFPSAAHVFLQHREAKAPVACP